MRLDEIESQPRSELDADAKTYIVYDENGKEFSRHPFQHVWDSSPAMRAAKADVLKLRTELYKVRSAKGKEEAEAKPLSRIEQEYVDILGKWQRYYDTMFSKDPNKRLQNIDDETKKVYIDQMDKWMKRLEQLNGSVRKSVQMGTRKT